jgi:hypothetical protein
MKVLVLGGGFAGVAAALAARRAGAAVTVVHHAAGASALYAGVVDYERNVSGAGPLELMAELARGLGLRLSSSTVVATREGVIRRAQGAESSLLDLAPLAGRRIALVDVARDDWDAPLLVRSFSESEWARQNGTRFELTPLPLLEKGHQRRISPFDFAAGLERAERPGWLLEVLKSMPRPDAWLFGPWLGIKRPLARELTTALGIPVGEVTSPPGGASGARFELRRDDFLGTLEVEMLTGAVRALRSTDTGVKLSLEGGRELVGDTAVVAVGGVASGALELTGVLSGAAPAGFRLGIEGLPAAQVRGELARPVSSLFGVDLAAHGRRLLERVGLPSAADGRLAGQPRVLVAGDVTAPEPPSVGHALVSGLMAGAAAARSA